MLMKFCPVILFAELYCFFFGRMATPIFPIMDNLHMDVFFLCAESFGLG